MTAKSFPPGCEIRADRDIAAGDAGASVTVPAPRADASAQHTNSPEIGGGV
jgi:hypothetical protein